MRFNGAALAGADIRSATVRGLLVLSVVLAGGCGPLRIRNPVPEDLADQAEIPGMPGVRFWGDAMTPGLARTVEESIRQEREFLRLPEDRADFPPANGLALSGGGSDGAFGAGLLCGWSETGTRPEFRFVTGVSTGALIAPFAFLGPAYDDRLKAMYTTISSKDLFFTNTLLTILRGDSLTNNTPMYEMAKRFVTDDVIRAVAAEHRKGRRLLVGTVNLDAQRPVIWDLGAIAASGAPGSAELFRKVMVASASIPVLFPPKYITVAACGEEYDEMHVDGCTATQVFLYPASLNAKSAAEALRFHRRRTAYIIRNARLAPDWETVAPRLGPIAGRGISTLIKYEGLGDLIRIWYGCRRDEIDYNLAYIPDDFRVESKEVFDKDYMNALFRLGYDSGRAGYCWHKRPPGLPLETSEPK